MANRQILILVLGLCLLGIAVSVGAIALQQEPAEKNRNEIVTQLLSIAADAQSFYRRPLVQGGGEGSFLLLTAVPHGLNRLPSLSEKVHGDFHVKQNGCSTAVQIIGVGVVPGSDQRLPVRAMVTVYPESSVISVLN